MGKDRIHVERFRPVCVFWPPIAPLFCSPPSRSKSPQRGDADHFENHCHKAWPSSIWSFMNSWTSLLLVKLCWKSREHDEIMMNVYDEIKNADEITLHTSLNHDMYKWQNHVRLTSVIRLLYVFISPCYFDTQANTVLAIVSDLFLVTKCGLTIRCKILWVCSFHFCRNTEIFNVDFAYACIDLFTYFYCGMCC